ncbi:MAG: hypothetical protein JNJ57_21655, partial [Saprospiraceae bacterium]|nr:hypothetical protein [Saprospiraceae bacterium]
MQKFMLLLLSFTWLLACKNDPKYDAEMLIGTWNGVDWKVQGKSATDRNASEVFFVFEKAGSAADKGRYIAAYGSQKERGAYKLDGDKLYTTADDNKIEKVVRILQLGAD